MMMMTSTWPIPFAIYNKHQTRFLGSKYYRNAVAATALSQTPLEQPIQQPRFLTRFGGASQRGEGEGLERGEGKKRRGKTGRWKMRRNKELAPLGPLLTKSYIRH